MKALVTGGSGFIGSHIVDLLVEKGYDVVVVDRELKNTNPKAKYYETDITNYPDLKRIFEKEEPELINHQAAHVSVPNSVEKPIYDAQNNILGTLNLLKLSKEYNVKNFVYASTCAVYGTPDIKYVTEDYTPKPESPYGVSKLTCEYYIPLFMDYYTILRYSNVYGPRQKGKMIMPIFITRMKRNQPVTIYGDGNFVRDYIYVDDIVNVNMKALENRKRTVLNVGTKKGTSVNEIFKILKELTNYKLEPNHETDRAGDARKIILDNRKLKTELAYEPKITLRKGLELTVSNF